MSHYLVELTVILILLVAMPFVVGPILIRFQQWQKAHPEFQTVSPDNFPAPLAQSFHATAEALASDGFVVVAHLYQRGQTQNITNYLVLLRNQAHGDMAALVSIIYKKGERLAFHNYVEFSTDFSNGIETNTNNSSKAGVFRDDPDKKIFRCPGVGDPRMLYRFHRRIIAPFAAQAAPVLPTEGLEIFHLCNSMTKSMAKQAEFGYYWFDEKTEVYRPTWKGAILMTWKLAWPVGPLRKAKMRRDSHARMRALNYGR